MTGLLDNKNFAMIAIAVLVKKLGGRAEITQDEINAVAYGRVLEDLGPAPDGVLALIYEERTKAS